LFSLFFSTKDKDWVKKKRRKTGHAVCNAAITMQTFIFCRNAERIFFGEYEKIEKQLENRRFYALKELSRPVQQYHMK
jgi:hypothetical protein